MTIKGLVDEDFLQYKEPCMVVLFPKCSFKCEKDCNRQVCQNGALATSPSFKIDIKDIVDRYVNNNLTSAICFQGLEPFDSWEDMYELILNFRIYSNDPIIIFTGYNKDEIIDKIKVLQLHRNIIVKFGRYIPNQEPHYDEVLGVKLASDNQYAERIS